MAAVYLGGQVKKPDWFAGRLFAGLMNGSHASLTDWALTHIEIAADATALDVGCGGGRTLSRLAAMAPDGMVYGIDYAKGSVAQSRAHNRKLVRTGKVVIENASVSQLPFEDGKFDVASAVETQYYWPSVENDMREILRVLKPSGRLMIVAESYKGAQNDWLLGPVMKLLGSSRLSVDDQRALFLAAGFREVEVFEERKRGWLYAIGKKP